MKRIFLILLMIPLFFVSCHKDLNVRQQSAITSGEAWEIPSDAEAGVYGMLNAFRHAYMGDYMYWGEYRTGLWWEGLAGFGPNDMQVFTNQIGTSVPQCRWNGLYRTINMANLVLKYTPDLGFSNEKEMQKILGEANFVRALCYYHIARIWGDAPICLQPFEADGQEGLYPSREPVTAVFAQVEQDLLTAAQYLEGAKLPSSMPNINAVHALQTDFYLWQYKVMKDESALEKAATACQAVIGKAKLLDSFEEVFSVNNELNEEIIFTVPLTKDEAEGGAPSGWLCPAQHVTGKYIQNPVEIGSHQQWQFPTAEYKNRFTEEDQRKEATYRTFFDVEKNRTQQWIQKFKGSWDNGARSFISDIPVYRYADILFFDAEIKLAKGDKAGALAAINQVAKRAYGDENHYSDETAVLDILVDERTLEFLGEGKLWWDYIRLGVVFDEVPTLAGKENNKNILLWPLHQDALNENPNLVQTEIQY